jgi:hypothetical protein
LNHIRFTIAILGTDGVGMDTPMNTGDTFQQDILEQITIIFKDRHTVHHHRDMATKEEGVLVRVRGKGMVVDRHTMEDINLVDNFR